MNNRRDFLKFSAGIVPAMALGLPLLHSAQNLKVFCLDSGGDVSYIIAESPERVKHWWFTELGGEEVPDDAKVTEISPDTVISQGIEDLDDISEEDQKHYLYYQISYNNSFERKGQWWSSTANRLGLTPKEMIEMINIARPFTSDRFKRIEFCITKPAALFLKDTIENQYPIPCCFCTTAG